MISKIVRFFMGASLFLSRDTWKDLREQNISLRRVFFGLLLYIVDKGFRQIVETKMTALIKGANDTIHSGESIIAILTPTNGNTRRISNELELS